MWLLPLLALLGASPWVPTGYVNLNSLYYDLGPQTGMVHAAAVRLKWHLRVGPFDGKIHGQAGFLSANALLVPFLTGLDLDTLEPALIHRGTESTAFAYFDRFALDYAGDRFEVRVGRDRYAWGKARILSVLDRWNPYVPFALFQDERQGVNGARVQVFFSGFTWVEGIYTRFRGRDRWGAALRTTVGAFDVQAVVARDGATLFGVAFEGDVFGFGVRGEGIAWRDGPTEYVIGVDRQVTSRFYVMGEYLHSAGRFYPPGDAVVVSLELEPAPLHRIQLGYIRIDPGGTLWSLGYRYSLATDWELVVTGIYTTGRGAFGFPRIFGTGLRLDF